MVTLRWEDSVKANLWRFVPETLTATFPSIPYGQAVLRGSVMLGSLSSV